MSRHRVSLTTAAIAAVALFLAASPALARGGGRGYSGGFSRGYYGAGYGRGYYGGGYYRGYYGRGYYGAGYARGYYGDKYHSGDYAGNGGY